MKDIKLLFERHAYDFPAVDDWLEENGAEDAVSAKEMRGRFSDSKVSHIYKYTLAPDLNGPHRAIVMPVIEQGHTVDIIAFRYSANTKKLDVWGCVTGAGRFLNRDAIYDKSRNKPLRVNEHWSQWLRDSSGVLPIKISAIHELRDAGDVVVANSSHALQLLYEAYLLPTNSDANGPVWKAARLEGRKRIWIDDARYEA